MSEHIFSQRLKSWFFSLILLAFPLFASSTSVGLYHEGSLMSSNLNDSLKRSVHFYGNYYSRSGTINQSINSSLLFNRFMDQAQKTGISEGLENQNYLNLELAYGLGYSMHGLVPPLMKNAFWGVSFKRRALYNGEFTDDAVNLTLFGNKMFEASPAIIGPGNLRITELNEYRIHYGFRREFREFNINTNLMLSLVQGVSHREMQLRQGEFYTAQDGEYLWINYNLFYRQSASNGGFFDWNGTGFNAGVHAEVEVENLRFNLIATDIGSIRWNYGLEKFEVDTNFTFEGVFIPKIFDLDDPDFIDDYVDSLQRTYFPNVEANAYQTVLPAFFSLRGGVQFNDNLYVGLGTSYRRLDGEPFSFWIDAAYRPIDYFLISALAGYSTLEGVLLGVELHTDFKYFNLFVGSSRLAGLISPSNFTSGELYSGMRIKF